MDQTSPSNVGVGLFFRAAGHDALRVSSIAPGTSAYRSGKIAIGDKLLSLNDESVARWNLAALRSKLHGIPGTFVSLEFERTQEEMKQKYKISLMRGTAHFMDYYDEHEAFGTSTLNSIEAKKIKLLMRKKEEQQMCLSIEECLRDEQEELNKVLEERRLLSAQNTELVEWLNALQN